MGSPPPPDSPSPEQQDASAVEAGFKQGPAVGDLCGFKLPSLIFEFGLNLDLPFAFPPTIPIPKISLGLTCDLTNPIDVTAGIAYGGGRKATFDPDPDE